METDHPLHQLRSLGQVSRPLFATSRVRLEHASLAAGGPPGAGAKGCDGQSECPLSGRLLVDRGDPVKVT